MHFLSFIFPKFKSYYNQLETISNEYQLKQVSVAYHRDYQCYKYSVTKELNRVDLLDIRNNLYSSKIDILYTDSFLDRSKTSFWAFDMDSTLIKEEVIDELALLNGVYSEVSRVTELAMQGAVNFDEALKERCKLLKGLDENTFYFLFKKLTLQEGVKEFLEDLQMTNHIKGILSGGFTPILSQFTKEYGFHFYKANQLIIEDCKITGEITGEIINSEKKKEYFLSFFKEYKINHNQTVSVGDGSNDFEMISASKFGVGFQPKDGLKKKLINYLEHSPFYVLNFLFEGNPFIH